MDGKKYKTVQLSTVYLPNCEILISEFEEIFNKIKCEYSNYQDLSASFHEYYPGSDYDGEEDAHVIFWGDTLETDEEYEKRLKEEIEREKIIKKQEEYNKKIKERMEKEKEEFDRKEYERLKKKYE